jgi:signal transduction histidine kinase
MHADDLGIQGSRPAGPAGPATYFAPPERASLKDLQEQLRLTEVSPIIRALLQAVDGLLVVLNPQRQIVAASDPVILGPGRGSIAATLGVRPGELLRCVRVPEAPNGCGTSRHCAECGAVLAILASQETRQTAVRECLLTVGRNGHTEAHEFRVQASPLTVGRHNLTAVVLRDVSNEKRREALEQVFFHDVLNTIGGLAGWSKLLRALEGERAKDAARRIAALCDRLTQEVQNQRALLQAERGDLAVSLVSTTPAEILETLGTVFAGHEAAADRQLDIAVASPHERIGTDPSLLVRVLTNMVKNALEATPPGSAVRVWYERREGRPGFFVWNAGAMSDGVARRVFQRSFSTKGEKGRGLGTYSMKLFGERYLGGSVSCASDPESGTLFRIILPPASLSAVG